MGSFKICVSAGRGILVDETFDEQKSSPSWGKPLQEYSPPLLLPFFNYEGQEGRIRITRLVDVRFWVGGRGSDEYIEFNTCAMVTNMPGALGNAEMWIGSNTMRIWPTPSRYSFKGFLCRDDNGTTWEIQTFPRFPVGA